MSPESFAELINAGESPSQALARLERDRDFVKIMASEPGQALLEWLADDAASRRGGASTTSEKSPEEPR